MATKDPYKAELEKYEKLLSRKKEEVADLEVVVATLGKLAGRRVEVAEPEGEDAEPELPHIEPDLSVNYANMEGAAIIALERVGRPLRLRQIWDVLMMMGYRYQKGFDVWRGSIHPTIRASQRISRPARGFYGLTAWQNQTAVTDGGRVQ